MMRSAMRKPATGFSGFKENWKGDLISGFLVSLIALPLSLGIAGASNFPPIMGVFTAIIGGVVVAFFTNSELTIKGPAAGLIVIVAGAVDELGKDNATLGWHLSLGAIVIAGFIQILIGIFKLPRLADLFPISAVYGMLAAIGIVIMSKQLHLAVGVSPVELQGKSPLKLIGMLPHSLMHMEYHIAIIGLVSLMIMFGWKYLSFSFFKKVPPALVVLVISVLLGQFFHLSGQSYRDFKPLVDPGEFTLGLHVEFGVMESDLLPVFIKFVAMFALIGSLESVLTVKAVDLLDPFRRKTDVSRDLVTVGAANIFAGMLGGLPMISEAARSSANIRNGGKTRWANFFHGVCLLIFLVFFAQLIKMVPVAAIAAMLIFVGFRLASLSEFTDIYHLGKEQLIIFLVTIIVTLGTDLLVGAVAGVIAKVFIQLSYGVKLSHIFAPKIELKVEGEKSFIYVPRAAVFTNYLSLKAKLESLPKGKEVQVDFSDSPYVDHTVMENVARFKNDYERSGGHMGLIGFEHQAALSDHPLEARRNQKREAVLS